MKLLYTYRMILLATEGKFSCPKSACKVENVSHDKLTRFLSNNNEKIELDIKYRHIWDKQRVTKNEVIREELKKLH